MLRFSHGSVNSREALQKRLKRNNAHCHVNYHILVAKAFFVNHKDFIVYKILIFTSILSTMPLQNRVTPYGNIIATPERGTLLGNRGVLINQQRQLVRNYQVKRWICCQLQYKGRWRPVMQPNRWTELFFLDEATAFAAGHRPCFECRNAAAKTFQAAWEKDGLGPSNVAAMDAVLDQDRKHPGGSKKTYTAPVSSLPDGVFITVNDQAWLKHQGKFLRWTPGGYTEAKPIISSTVTVLTPKSTVAVIAAGYQLGIHPSATQF